jgi:hypothetical protein
MKTTMRWWHSHNTHDDVSVSNRSRAGFSPALETQPHRQGWLKFLYLYISLLPGLTYGTYCICRQLNCVCMLKTFLHSTMAFMDFRQSLQNTTLSDHTAAWLIQPELVNSLRSYFSILHLHWYCCWKTTSLTQLSNGHCEQDNFHMRPVDSSMESLLYRWCCNVVNVWIIYKSLPTFQIVCRHWTCWWCFCNPNLVNTTWKPESIRKLRYAYRSIDT